MMERELTKVIRRLASVGWQASGEALAYKEKWENVARAIYDELIKIDEERALCQDSANFQEKK